MEKPALEDTISADQYDSVVSHNFSFTRSSTTSRPNQRPDFKCYRSKFLNTFDDTRDESVVIKSGPEFRKQNVRQLDSVTVLNSDREIEPIISFGDIELEQHLAYNVSESYPEGPTVIQSVAIPHILSDHAGDILIRSHTGSGKTAAFLIPVIQKIIDAKVDNGMEPLSPFAIVMVPTRELAIQVAKEASILCRGTHVTVSFLIGSICNSDLRIKLERGCDIVIGTPGRLGHFFFEGGGMNKDEPFLSCESLRFFVMDEADRLLNDDHAREAVTQFKEQCSLTNYQIIVNSATITMDTYDDDILYQPLSIIVGHTLPVETVVQRFVNVSSKRPANVPPECRLHYPAMAWRCNKLDYLLAILGPLRDQPRPFPKVIVFVNTKRRSDSLALSLLMFNYRALAINGDHNMNQRQRTIRLFREGKVDVLVATDVLSRGVNVPGVELVINYDLPVRRVEEYVHRVGRTGRLGNYGLAISFYNPSEDFQMATVVEKVLQYTGQEVPNYLSETIQSQIEDFLQLTFVSEKRAEISSGQLPRWRTDLDSDIEFM